MIYIFLCGVYGRVEHTKSPEFFHVPFLRNLRSTIFRPRVTKSPDFSKIENASRGHSLSYQELSTNVFMIKKTKPFILIQFLSKLSCILPKNAVFWPFWANFLKFLTFLGCYNFDNACVWSYLGRESLLAN